MIFAKPFLLKYKGPERGPIHFVLAEESPRLSPLTLRIVCVMSSGEGDEVVEAMSDIVGRRRRVC